MLFFVKMVGGFGTHQRAPDNWSRFKLSRLWHSESIQKTVGRMHTRARPTALY